uniref:NADH-ubiquinone oxidoreductase chain 6 n=1 Tax=Platerodrilus sp. MNCN/DNA:86739 TaxID=1905348 RepID=A0A342Z5F2_9COLE|nr:NADH dehydrogenase subunit 6 [Platerodrilus sp. MNCN/DNA:86739]
MILMNLIVLISTTFMIVNHPLSMGLMLIMQTILISMMMGMMSMKFWYSYIIFIIMIGGMMVLFLYMTSISSNKKFNFSWKMTISTVVFLMLLIFINISMPHTANINFLMPMSKFFNLYSMGMMIMLMSYFLITLIAVVKITKTNFGPLRQK